MLTGSEGEQGSPRGHVNERNVTIKTKDRLNDLDNCSESSKDVVLPKRIEAAEGRLDLAEGDIKDLQLLYGQE